jgi:iron complex outermembrane receptor protein
MKQNCAKAYVLAVTCALSTTTQAADEQATSGGSDLQEIVVTAQRRSERLQDVPLSVSVLSAESLASSGIRDSLDLGQKTPGLTFVANAAYTSPAIRGISTTSSQPGSNANVATYVDGVYMQAEAGNILQFSDVDRIEVLLGPQGTLFGRNATGGAIQIFTRGPSFIPAADAGFSYGRYNELDAHTFVTGPLSQTVAGSLSLDYGRSDGYLRDIVAGGPRGGTDSYVARGKLLFKPTDEMEWTLSVNDTNRHDSAALATAVVNGNSAVSAFVPTGDIPNRPYQVANNTPTLVNSDHLGIDLHGKYDIDAGTLTSITAWYRDQIFISSDVDGLAFPAAAFLVQQPDKNFTQELNFASSKMGTFSWIGGLYFFDGNARFAPLDLTTGPTNELALQVNADVDIRGYAAFGEANFDFTDKLTAILGVRFSHESQDWAGAGTGDPVRDLNSASWSNTSPRFSLRYKFDDSTNVYFTYSQGFKSGAFNSLSPPAVSSAAPPAVSPERLNAYEIGFKSFPVSSLAVNGAAYYYDYKDMQVQTQVGDIAELQNAGSAKIYGADLSAQYQIMPSLRLNAGVAYLHARYDQFVDATIDCPLQNPTASRYCPASAALSGGNQTLAADMSGAPLDRAPDWTSNFGVDYDHALWGGTGTASLNAFLSAKYYFDVGDRLAQPSYHLINATLSWQPQNKRYRVSVWAKNLTNQVYVESMLASAFGDFQAFAPPRTAGISADFHF